MDWENHIVITPECRALAGEFAPFATEDFLVTLGNKGLYKRAVKDCAALEACSMQAQDGALAVTMDGVTATLQKTLGQSACSCPSKTVCKHILMAVLCAAQAAAHQEEAGQHTPGTADTTETAAESSKRDGEAENAAPPEEPYAALKHADPAALRKRAGKRMFEDTLRLVQEGWTAEFSEGDMLAAAINTENVTVYFPKEDSIARAVCKCGAQGLCRHKLIAILSYLSRSGPLESAGGETHIPLLGEEMIALLRAADDFVVDILEKGVACAGENDEETAVQLSLRLDSQGAGNLARAFRGLSTDFENLRNKNAAFSQTNVFSTIARLHNTILLLLRNPDNRAVVSALLEGSRSEYYTTPAGTFTGLGAYPWQTRSGYFGITALLYHHEKQRVCTYTSSMADYYESTASYANLNNLNAQFLHGEHWEPGLSLQAISSSTLVLGNFKSNLRNRISSSKQTQARITGKTDMERIVPLPITGRMGAYTGEEEAYDYFAKQRPEDVVIFCAEAIDEIVFDKAAQTLYMTLTDENGNRVQTQIRYSQVNERAIVHMELYKSRRKFTKSCFICLNRRGILTPVSMVTKDGMENFYFD